MASLFVNFLWQSPDQAMAARPGSGRVDAAGSRCQKAKNSKEPNMTQVIVDPPHGRRGRQNRHKNERGKSNGNSNKSGNGRNHRIRRNG
jgi:hypothetical protein